MPDSRADWRALYPFESRWFTVRGGLRLHYVDEGRGEPLVCVHGNPSWSFYFRQLIYELRGDYRVIALDHIGCGLSDKPGDDRYDYCLQSRVEDLEALLDHLGLDQGVTFVLHDWGGMIGMAAALRHPQRVARFVLMNTAAFLLPTGKRLPWRLRLIRDGGPIGALLVQGFNAFARGAVHMAVTRPMPPAVRAGYLAPYDSWANRIATLRFVQDIPLKPGDKSYALVKGVDEHMHELADRPTLICWGLRDFVFDSHFLREWQRRFPHAEAHVFEDADHYVLEDAGLRIVTILRGFLAHAFVAPASSR